jgi:hypothetical protein
MPRKNTRQTETDTPAANGQPTPADTNDRPAPPPDGGQADDDARLDENAEVDQLDPYSPEALGLSQDFAAEAGVAKLWDVIKVQAPGKSRVFRVHSDPKFRMQTVLLVLKEDNEVYLVPRPMRKALAGESLCGVYTLFACVTKAGTPFLWPVHMAGPDGKWNVWHQSAYQIALKAQVRWARVQANRDAGHYVAEYDRRPPEQQQAPAFPDMTFSEWIKLAFQGHRIDTPDHPVLKHLRLED